MSAKQLEILVVDDESIVGARLKPTLEKDGYVVESFSDSKLAKERLENHRFDIVISDVMMGEIDGMQLLAFIREKWPQTRVIIMSGYATLDMTRKAFRQGVVDVLAKPFKIRQLKELIRNISLEIQNNAQ